ncbi:MAG: hypothetical protein LBV69_00575 [Bacteroidales bacterium]|jgi:hypothetical protein|nr:hypothetical protein [Bacteroidales bacterium]
MTPIIMAIAFFIRTTTWMSIDDVLDNINIQAGKISKSALYSFFIRKGINIKPKEKQFKEYYPGFLHIDLRKCSKE